MRSVIKVLLAAVVAVSCDGEGPSPGELASRAPSSETFRAAVEVALPAVVYIQVEARPVRTGGPGLPFGIPDESPLPSTGAGSGVIFDSRGYILTSNHVVQQADRVTVLLHDRRRFEARVVARDPSTDVAVVRIEGDDLPVARLGDSDQLRLGDWVLALGSPLDLQFSVTAGVVSAIGRAIGILGTGVDGEQATAPLEHFIQTDAAINPGNSGGPLVNLNGEVVGINTAIASPTGFYSGYGFAVPINLARRAAEHLIRYGHVRRAYLGVLLNDIEPADVTVYGLEAAQGAEVVSVSPESPAARAGVQLGDVIVAVDTLEVRTVSDLQAALATMDPGRTVTLRAIRYGQQVEIAVELGMIRSGVTAEPPPPLEEPTRVGFAVAEEGGKVVVAAVRPYSAAARAGIRVGQEVLSVNRQAVRTLQDFSDAIRKTEDQAISVIVRDARLGPVIVNFEPGG